MFINVRQLPYAALIVLASACTTAGRAQDAATADSPATTFRLRVDRGEDVGQSFGSLFEVTSEDGSLVIGAGFQNSFNSYLRADRHALQFFVRSTDDAAEVEVERLPRPNDLCGTYLYGRDEVVYSTYGGLKRWDASARRWQDVPSYGGNEESMRVGSEVLEFGDSTVRYARKEILPRPERGHYQNFFYADGKLCFYHVDRGTGPYRPYVRDEEGFSKLYACPWKPGEASVDLSRAIVMTLPVVGEVTFAWGQFGTQVLTGSNVGGFYVLEADRWRMLLEPQLGVSYQLYSTLAFYDRLLMGQYPTGRIFAYDGREIRDQAGWPPIMPGVSSSAREAQTTIVYGGELFAGVWPWGELWRYRPDSQQWSFVQRMFDHPQPADDIVHPYDRENSDHDVPNLWGQRVTSLVTCGQDLFVSTSAKNPHPWNPDAFPFLAPELWKSYGSVYRLRMPGHLGAATSWTGDATTFELVLRGAEMSILQDGRQLATATVTGPLAERLRKLAALRPVRWGQGIYGPFAGGALEGTVEH